MKSALAATFVTDRWGRAQTAGALGAVVVCALIAIGLSGSLSQDALDIGATLFVYVTLAEAWNILAGFSGQISLGVGAFVGMGAYAMALVMIHAGIGAVSGLAVAAAAGGVFGVLLALPLLRLRGDYFAIGTLAAALALQAWFLNWSFVGESTGLSIPITAVPSMRGLFITGVVVGAVAVGGAIAVRGSRFGLRLLSVREDEEAAATLGVDTWKVRLGALVVSSVLTGLAGGTFALLQVSFEPNGMIGINWTIWALMMVVLGGFGTIIGPLVGAVFVYYVITTDLASYPTLGLFIEGALLILVVRFAPNGVVPLVVDSAKSALARLSSARAKDGEVPDAVERADQVATAEVGVRAGAPTVDGGTDGVDPEGDATTGGRLVVHEAVKQFGAVVATDRVSLDVGAGEAVGLIGPNGSGKTTLLKLIAGIERPDAGTITLGGVSLAGKKAHLVNRLGVALARQVPRPFADLTVHENIALAASHHARRRVHRSEVVDEVLDMCALGHRSHEKARSLGLLDLKRLELARALATNPSLVLIDEVAAGLVGRELTAAIELIKRINASGRSILVVEHVQQVIGEVVERVLVLASGQLIAQGTPAEVAADKTVQEVYYGAHTAPVGNGRRARRMTAEPGLLEVENLSAGYGSLLALREVGLAIGEGEIVSVLGANGAGKSTLAATVSGQVRARRGAIRFLGRDVTRLAAHVRARRGICLCPEGRGVFARHSVEENLLLGVRLRRAHSEVQENLDRVYEMLPPLRPRGRQHAGSLSGGEQQMLAIGRALMMSPRLLICDELSLGLAPKIVDELYEILVRVNDAGVAILLIEQNVHRALEISTNVYVLNRGRVTYSGSPKNLRDDEVLADAYFASSSTETVRSSESAVTDRS